MNAAPVNPSYVHNLSNYYTQTLLNNSANLNPHSRIKSQNFHTQNTTKNCSYCQSRSLTSHKIIIHKAVLTTAAPVNPPAVNRT